MFRKILSVGGWTLVSRLTGFIRDVVLAAVMGVGPIADAFVVASRIRTISGPSSAKAPSTARSSPLTRACSNGKVPPLPARLPAASAP